MKRNVKRKLSDDELPEKFHRAAPEARQYIERSEEWLQGELHGSEHHLRMRAKEGAHRTEGVQTYQILSDQQPNRVLRTVVCVQDICNIWFCGLVALKTPNLTVKS